MTPVQVGPDATTLRAMFHRDVIGANRAGDGKRMACAPKTMT